MKPGQVRDGGPLGWVAIIAITCLLLFLLQKILWLVVPLLLALITCYLVFPLKQRLVLAGLAHDSAAVLSALLVFGGVVSGLLQLAPALAANAANWQEGAWRYLGGGLQLLVTTLSWLEQNSALAASAGLSQALLTQMARLNDLVPAEYLAAALLTLAAWLPSLLLIPFIAFFFLRDGWRFRRYLCAAVPNAYFERTLYLLDEIDRTAHSYFRGLATLTLIDTLFLASGLWLLGVSAPLLLGVVTAVLAWIPYVGSVLGCLLVVLVAATDFPGDPAIAYGAIVLFIAVRLLDDFVFMPLTIGRSLKMHPLLTVMMIFAGGAVAGVAGMVLVLPLFGVIMVLGHSLAALIADARLRARHRHASRLRDALAQRDLQ